MPLAIDRRKMIRFVQARLDRTERPRHRRNLELLLAHMEGEVVADIDALLRTLTPECEYRAYGAGPEFQPRGHAGVRRFYEERAAAGQLYLEYDMEHLVVDEDAVVTDGVMRMVMPARSMAQYGVADDGSFYLVVMRMAVVWPVAADGLFRGEETLSSLLSLEKLAPADVPEDLRR
ncbi:MAG TPA: nuclear transport factor 2 family protein [Burkholderiales bacterium]|nr:nuclear transport factor 2 family protein [Burkholderiales bacterium]